MSNFWKSNGVQFFNDLQQGWGPYIYISGHNGHRSNSSFDVIMVLAQIVCQEIHPTKNVVYIFSLNFQSSACTVFWEVENLNSGIFWQFEVQLTQFRENPQLLCKQMLRKLFCTNANIPLISCRIQALCIGNAEKNFRKFERTSIYILTAHM